MVAKTDNCSADYWAVDSAALLVNLSVGDSVVYWVDLSDNWSVDHWVD